MKLMRKLSAVLLSAAVLCSAAPIPVQAAGSSSFAETIRKAWDTHQTELSVRSFRMSADAFAKAYYSLLYTEADRFYIASTFSYATTLTGYVDSIEIRYNYDISEIENLKTAFENEADRVVGLLRPEWTDAQKVLFFHDHLASVCAYDLGLTKGDAYAALLGGSAVCQGYSLAMCVLCRKAGIPCYAITSDELKHMWNVVQIDGEWYQLDVTDDDSAPDMLGHVSHNFVLRTDEAMMADYHHSADDWNYFSDGNVISCTSDLYENAFWFGSNDIIQVLPDGRYLFARSNDSSNITSVSQVKADIYCGEDPFQKLKTVQAYWKADNGIYTNCYVCTVEYNDTVYYNTPDTIWAMPVSGGTPVQFYTLTTAEKKLGDIYGLSVDENGLLTYQIQLAPGFLDETYTLDQTYHTIQLPSAQETTSESTTTTSETTTSTTSDTTTTKPATTTTTVTTASQPTTTSTETTTSQPTTASATTTSSTTTSTTTTTTTTTSATTSSTTSTTTSASTTSTTTTTTTTSATTTTTTTTTTTSTSTTTTTTTTTATTTSASATTTTTTTASDPPKPTFPGDLNCDGKRDVVDAVLLARLTGGDITLTLKPEGLANADCNSDGSRNPLDLTWLLRVLARLLQP